MITAVVVDIGGVLEIVEDATWPQLWIERWRAVGAAGRPADRPASQLVDRSGMTERQLRASYQAELGLTDRQADAMMVDMWDSYCGRLDVVMRDFVAGLRPRYRTAILSNSADGARREEQRRYDFAGLVDTIVYSHEVGVAKPEPAIYEITADRIGAEPDEILFLDDSPAAVEGARVAGWYAVQHVDTATLIAQLTAVLERGGLPR